MTIKVKKGGVYTDPVAIFAKKAGVYTAVAGVFDKVAGSYTQVDRVTDQQIAALFAKISDPTKPMPAFIEGWASNTFNGQNYNIPTGYATVAADSEGNRIFNITVSGAAGDSTLTGTGFNTTQGAGTWGCSILHDNGTYGLYTASGITATSIAIAPPLRATTTAKNLAALSGEINGQHYGLQGYKALARRIFAATNADGYRLRYAARLPANAASGWTKVGGNPFVGYQLSRNAFPSTGAGSYWNARGNVVSYLNTALAGLGVSHTATLTGLTGYVELFAGLAIGSGPFRVRVLLDGVETFNQTYTAFTRVAVPFSGATTGVIEVTTTAAVSTQIDFGDLTWWAFDRSATWTDRVIGPNDKVVQLGDSWSARYSGGIGLEIAQAQIDAGGTTGSVTTVALGGQTSEWGLAQFDSQVAPLNPNVVVIEYFVNDRNSFGVANYNRWLKAMYQIAIKCQAIGARPVFVMPLQTQSQSQSAELGIMSEKIGAGLSV
jgi:hypothetical protein